MKTLNEKNRGNTNIAGTSQQTLQSQSPGSRHAAGGTPGRPAHAGQASQRRRAQRWSRRFGGLPVRGTAPHCATPRSAGQLLASPTTPNSRRRPHPTVRTRWAGHVWSLSCIGPARGGPAVVCVLRSGTAVQTRFCARCEQRRALDAQVCCEAPFLAQPALCMHTPRAHYPAVRLGRTDHGRLPFLACTRCPLFRSPPVVFGKVDTGVLCPSYFRTQHTVCLSQHPVNDTWVLRIAVAWSLCALTMFHQDLFLCVLRTVMSFAPGHIERTPRPAWVAPSYGLCAHSLRGFVSRPSASCALLLPSSFEAAHTDA